MRDMMIWKVVFLTVFVAGLALAVSSMLHGAERWRRRRSNAPSPVFNPPTVAVLAIGIGLCGYLLTTRTTLGWVGIAVLSLVSGIASFAGMTVLMAKWALRANGDAGSNDDENTHGQIATVSRTITPSEIGEITYFAWECHHVLPASAIDSSVIPTGTEVVIDSLENGVARVELWSVVELRL